ncbi:B12-binding domain-containing radical SAM protein [Dissulfurirhabdus thermomarina]|uniref:B12-binding domain-containing radical SAM protein n=2 Tax=Dissulfurirhabdus thermomarina TaxID=1765737 RepID=A0A6N9TJH6_DISTH|nr:radical SAM protein [Dissulfurirhabdus thermomarina]NDY41405.1 B12-binding domain-containing radical SAM protein [Dissulfurirhabdus thermomarina]NMX23579.1 B12-binding domain-containing radical SAM protein [Dissulfurirhabdus thermomarina]
MHILFVVPGWPRDSFWDVLCFKFPPLALATLAGLTPRRHRLSYVDESLAPVDFDLGPDLVVISAMTPLAPRGYEIADAFRARGAKVVIGGIHASNLPEEAGRHADAVVVGEADEIWPEILADAERGRLKPLYRQAAYTRMDRVPAADRGIYPRKGYFFENMIQTTRGCPYRCEFCTVTAFFGGTYRCRPVERILEEVAALRRAPGYVFFCDDNLIARRDHVLRLLDGLRGHRLRWVCQAPVTLAKDDDLLRRMAEAGCHGVFIGFESLRPENIEVMGKRHNKVEFYEEAVHRIHDHGIGVHGSFVFGYDHDTPAVFDQFLDFAHRTALDGAFLPVLTPFPGTRIHRRLKAEGRILTEDWRRYDMATVVYRPRGMSVAELQEGFWKVNAGFYSLGSTLRRLFRPSGLRRRSHIIFMPMNFGHIPAVRKARRAFTPTPEAA